MPLRFGIFLFDSSLCLSHSPSWSYCNLLVTITVTNPLVSQFYFPASQLFLNVDFNNALTLAIILAR